MKKKNFENASLEIVITNKEMFMAEIDPIMSGQEDFDKKTALGD